jgi:release factor glutamine methyltransferase
LVSSDNGFCDIFHIVRSAREYLKPGGVLMLEHGYEQGDAVIAFFRECGYRDVAAVKDLSGHDRVVMGILGSSPS